MPPSRGAVARDAGRALAGCVGDRGQSHAFLAHAFLANVWLAHAWLARRVTALTLVEEGALAIAHALEIARLVTSLEAKQPR
jgi:hypothetical protein